MAEQTLLQIVQSFARKRALPYPSVVVTATDPWVLQAWELLNEEVAEHANREYNFPKLKVTTTFTYTTDPAYVAVNLDTAAAFGTGAYRSMVSETLWDRTQRLQVAGPIPDDKWAQMLAMGSAPSYPVYRVLGNNLLIFPVNSSAHTYACDYMSKFAVQATGGGALKETWTADTDVPLMPTRIVKQGLEWRWLKSKGLSYAEEFRQYEQFLLEEAGREIIPTTCKLDNIPNRYEAGPGLLIASGTWNL